ncbi:NUDIX domain-containing protein [Saliphagus sp. GCM10025334]
MGTRSPTYVHKSCAYITRDEAELLAFESPEHDGLQIPKGTIEPGESPRAAVFREIVEESGLSAVGSTSHVASDVWNRYESPPKYYVRHFFHATVHDAPDEFTHVVTGEGEEVGLEFEYSWIDLRETHTFALDLDDYVHLLEGAPNQPTAVGSAAD